MLLFIRIFSKQATFFKLSFWLSDPLDVRKSNFFDLVGLSDWFDWNRCWNFWFIFRAQNCWNTFSDGQVLTFPHVYRQMSHPTQMSTKKKNIFNSINFYNWSLQKFSGGPHPLRMSAVPLPWLAHSNLFYSCRSALLVQIVLATKNRWKCS